MNKSIVWCASAIAWTAMVRAASAGVPAWCHGASFEIGDFELQQLSDKSDPERLVTALAEASCSTSDVAKAHASEIAAARAAWGKKYGLAEDDWAEVIAYDQDSDHRFFHADFSTKDITRFTPVDQFKLIAKGFGDSSVNPDPLYYTDALDGSLSEAGRVAFLDWCMQSTYGGDHDVAKWAVCQGDIDKLDLGKLFAELHADPHDGSSKFYIRLRGVELQDQLKDYAAAKAKLIQQDDTYAKIFEVAAQGRAEWAKTIGSNTELLRLVLDMDAAHGFQSRKLLAGCEARTSDALAAAISTIPARAFANMHDNREDPYNGFAKQALDVLARSPEVSLAAIAYNLCHDDDLSSLVGGLIQGTPTSRGPRDWALTAIMGTEFTFDDVSKTSLHFPSLEDRPYHGDSQAGSVGGVVKSIKIVGDQAIVTPEKVIERQADCVQEHRTSRIIRIDNTGNVQYEVVCDKWAMVAHDMSCGDVQLDAAAAKWLRPGMVFSASFGAGHSFLLATWPSRTAKLPNMVLGARVK